MEVEASAAFTRPSTAIASGAVATALVLLLSHGSLIAFSKRCLGRQGGYKSLKSLYEDEDGKATEESQRQHSTSVKAPTTVALLATLLGLGVSVAAIVFQTRCIETFVVVDGCLRLGSWILLCFQASHVFTEHRPTVRFRSGVLSMCSAAIVLLQLAAACIFCIDWRGSSDDAKKLLIAFPATQAGLAVIAGVSFVCIPRRPMIYAYDKKPVDAEHTVSGLARMTFAWAFPLLRYVRKHKKLTLDEIPCLADFARADTLQRTFNSEKKQGRRLWLQLVVYLRGAFTKQMTLISIVSITQFLPQLAMYNLLNLLERRAPGGAVAPVAWVWVLGLFAAMLISSWIEAFLFWIVMAEIAVPCRNLLSTLVFLKSTRRKDVKGVQGAKKAVQKAVEGDEPAINLNNGKVDREEDTAVGADDEGEEDETGQKSRQNTINLVGVDTNRVADFCSYVYIFPGSVVKLVVSFTFLWKLVGWIPLLAGVIAFFAALPLNIWFSRNYNSLQGVLMKMRDIKLAVVTEAVQGIRQIKFSAVEEQWEGRINEKRENELRTLWKTFCWDSALIAIWIFGPVMLAAALLATYSLIQGELSPSVAFTAVAILNSIEVTLAVVPELTTDAIDAWVSLKRIEEYLNAPEKTDCLTASSAIALRNASIAWPADSQEEDADRFVLRNLNLEFPRGELSVITGSTGAGKSLLLAALLGEVDKMDGTIEMPKPPPLDDQFNSKATKDNWIIDSAVGFVAQIPWIENATIKENIVWGLPVDNGRYKTVLSVCALEKDLKSLEDGDLTDIGANGVNLSGGQRWRVSFARALYSRAGILVLDDIFSAVDAHVGRQLFEDALTGDLGRGRTRILVTHHIGLCISKTKYTVSLQNGRIEYAGDVDDLRRSGDIDEMMKNDQAFEEEEEEQAEEAVEDAEEATEQQNGDGASLRLILSRRRSSAAVMLDGSTGAATKDKIGPKKFSEAEGRETGRIKTHIYAEYIRTSGGAKIWGPLIFIFLLNMVLPLLRSYWVTIWTRSYKTESANFSVPSISTLSYDAYLNQMPFTWNNTVPNMSASVSSSKNDLWYYLGIYIALSVLSVFIGTLKYFMTYVASLRASRKLFEQMLFVILRAPLRWLDTVPVGRILNRFSSDFNQIDSRISNALAFTLYRALETAGITVTALFVSPFMIPVALVLLAMVLLVALFYLSGAREIKRLESVSKSPIFEQFGSVLAGIGTIRAFGKAEEYKSRMYGKIDAFARAHWHNWVFNRWMGLQLNIIGALFALVVAAVIVSTDIDASLAGFALSFALSYTGAIIATIRGYANLEMVMNAAERIVEYASLPTEDLGGTQPPAAWPTEGCLEVSGLVAGYAPDLPPVLKGLSFTVQPHERIGVIGRTGAGKSTLSLALWRFINIREGTVKLDGLDTAAMTLHDLRSRLAIIPQDPVLFSGTVRSNLDPFDEHTDDELRDALERVHLVSGTVSRDTGAETENNDQAAPTTANNTNIFQSLTSKVSEGGLSLSQGQRQLLCLARAIVRKPKVMLLDEATSAVDMATDVLIQRSIREQFGGSTLLVIAHRLSTIADFDRILVMSDGRAVEFDSPRTLWGQRGVFYELCCSSGERELLEEIVHAGKAAGEDQE